MASLLKLEALVSGVPMPTTADVRKLISFDHETFETLHVLALDRCSSLQELADEAFRDLLTKHGRPVLLKEALNASAIGRKHPRPR